MVIELNGPMARVDLMSSDVCQHCGAQDFCRPSGAKRLIEAKNSIGAGVGDEVYIEVKTRTGLASFFILFGIPTIFGVIGLFLGAQRGDVYSLFFGISGVILGLTIAKIIDILFTKRHKFLPCIIEIIQKKVIV